MEIINSYSPSEFSNAEPGSAAISKLMNDIIKFNEQSSNAPIKSLAILSNPLDFLEDYDWPDDILPLFIMEELSKDVRRITNYEDDDVLFICTPKPVMSPILGKKGNSIIYDEDQSLLTLGFAGFVPINFRYEDNSYILAKYNAACNRFLAFARRLYVNDFFEYAAKEFINSHRHWLAPVEDQAEPLRRLSNGNNRKRKPE